MEFLSSSTKDTARLASLMAKEVLALPPRTKGALVIALFGDLGAGKTFFVRAFAKQAGVRTRVTSPTFLLARRYPLHRKRYRNIFHVDAYRTAGANELKSAGLPDILKDRENIVLIEWPEKVARKLPEDTMEVRIGHGEESSERHIVIQKRKKKK